MLPFSSESKALFRVQYCLKQLCQPQALLLVINSLYIMDQNRLVCVWPAKLINNMTLWVTSLKLFLKAAPEMTKTPQLSFFSFFSVWDRGGNKQVIPVLHSPQKPCAQRKSHSPSLSLWPWYLNITCTATPAVYPTHLPTEILTEQIWSRMHQSCMPLSMSETKLLKQTQSW